MKFASLTKAALGAALFSRSAFGTELDGRRGNLRKLQGNGNGNKGGGNKGGGGAGKFRPSKKNGILGSYIIVLEDTDEDVDVDAKADEILGKARGGRKTGAFGKNNGGKGSRKFKGFAVDGMSESDAAEIASSPDVAYVEQNQVMSISETQFGATWGIDRIDQRDLPLNGNYDLDGSGGKGEGMKAYILDTGVQTSHNEFGTRATWGINTSGDGNDSDCHGHGTHVAGTVGGSIYGVAKEIELIAVKVLTCSGSGSTAGVIQGVDWVAAQCADTTAEPNKSAKCVANMSLGGGFSSSLNAAVASAVDAGVVVAVAAGNDNGDACSKSPASEDKAVTVGSTTSSDSRSSFSNFGTCLDIFAPGSGITAAWIGSNSATNTISGTSMASPHVAGVAALVRQADPNLSAEQVTEALTGSATPDKVTDAKTGSPNKLVFVGEFAPIAPTTAPPTMAPTPCDGNAVVLELTTDNYPAETSWHVDKDGTEMGSGNGYSSALTLYEEDMCLPNGDYTFTIDDTWGDGICCAYGSGSYALKQGATVLASGGSFASSETKAFTVGGGAVGETVGETGRIGLTHAEKTISFRNSYVNPVVVAFINTRNGGESADVRVYDVTTNSFKIFLDEVPGKDGIHLEEEVSYIVMEEGSHTLDGGLTVQAGRHTTTSVRRATQDFVGDEITFDAAFTEIPAVLATLNTYNNGEFMTTLVTDVFDSNFELSQEALETGSTATEETIGWMAFSTGFGNNLISGYAPKDGLKDGVGQDGFTIDLAPAGFSSLPDLVVGVYGEHGKDGSYARGAGVFSATTQHVFAEEDTTKDNERGHTSEPFAWVGFAHDSDLLSVSATSYEASACKVAEDKCVDSSECCSGECLGNGKCM